MSIEPTDDVSKDKTSAPSETPEYSRLGAASLIVFLGVVIVLSAAIFGFQRMEAQLGAAQGAASPSASGAVLLFVGLLTPPVAAVVGLGLGMAGVASPRRRKLMPAVGIALNGAVVLVFLTTAVVTWVGIVSFLMSFSSGM